MARQQKITTIEGYWWTAEPKLPRGDNRPVVLGQTHTIEPPIQVCARGLHASPTALLALKNASYTSGDLLYRVRLSGIIKNDKREKYAASERTYLAMRDCTIELGELWNNISHPNKNIAEHVAQELTKDSNNPPQTIIKLAQIHMWCEREPQQHEILAQIEAAFQMLEASLI